MVLRQGNTVEFLEQLKVALLPESLKEESDIVDDIVGDFNSRIELGLRLFRKWEENFYDTMKSFDEAGIELRDYQIENLERFEEFLAHLGHGELLGYFREPTGAGKTMEYMFIAKTLDVPTLILVPRIDLLKQNLNVLKEIGYKDEEIGEISGDKKDFEGKKIVLCTNHSFLKIVDSEEENVVNFKDNLDLIIVDEVHKALGNKTSGKIITELEDRIDEETMLKISGARSMVVGYTATPKLRHKTVEDAYGKEIGRVSYARLIKEKFLVPLDLVTIDGYVEADFNEKDMLKDKELEVKLLEKNKIFEKLLDEYERSGEGLKTVVYCTTVEECRRFKELAEERGLKGSIFTSRHQDAKSMVDLEQRLDDGEINFLIGVDKFTEGWDYPNLEAVMLARFSLSPARIIQAVGRGMRPNSSKERCKVFQVDWRRKEYNYSTSELSSSIGSGHEYLTEFEVSHRGVGMCVEKCFDFMGEELGSVFVNSNESRYLKMHNLYCDKKAVHTRLDEFKDEFKIQDWYEFDFDILNTEKGKGFRVYLEQFLNIRSEIGPAVFRFEDYLNALNQMLASIGSEELDIREVLKRKILTVEDINTPKKLMKLALEQFENVKVYGIGWVSIFSKLDVVMTSRSLSIKNRAMLCKELFDEGTEGYDDLDGYIDFKSYARKKILTIEEINTPKKFMEISKESFGNIKILNFGWRKVSSELGFDGLKPLSSRKNRAMLCKELFDEGTEGYDDLDGYIDFKSYARKKILTIEEINTPKKFMNVTNETLKNIKILNYSWRRISKEFGFKNVDPSNNTKSRAPLCKELFDKDAEGYDDLDGYIDFENYVRRKILTIEEINTPKKFMSVTNETLKNIKILNYSWVRILEDLNLKNLSIFDALEGRAFLCKKLFDEGTEGYEELDWHINFKSYVRRKILTIEEINTPKKFMEISVKDFRNIKILGYGWGKIATKFNLTGLRVIGIKRDRAILCKELFDEDVEGYDDLDGYIDFKSYARRKILTIDEINTPRKFMDIERRALGKIKILNYSWGKIATEFDLEGLLPGNNKKDRAILCKELFGEDADGYYLLEFYINPREAFISAILKDDRFNTPRKIMNYTTDEFRKSTLLGFGWRTISSELGYKDINPCMSRKERAIFCKEIFEPGSDGYDELDKIIDGDQS